MKRPAFQFYPADWRKDVELQSCSMAAQGLWINAMCLAHECEPYGHLTVNGKAMNVAQLARQVGLGPRDAQALLDELLDAGVARRTEEGAIYSKRMVDDEDLRNRRAAGGGAGAEHGAKGAEAGKKGGRPSAAKGGSKTPLADPSEPPPSSSSSSSSSEDSPKTPKGGAVALKTWLETLKAKGDRPIPEGDPLFGYADEINLPREFLAIAWREFRHQHTQPDASASATGARISATRCVATGCGSGTSLRAGNTR
jgi:hypothetical protein